VLYRRIWSILGNYSILCCDTQKSGAAAGDSKAVEYVVIRIEEITVSHSVISRIFISGKEGQELMSELRVRRTPGYRFS
jgi:hypothetical protein